MFSWRRFVKTDAFKTISILLHIKSSINKISWHFCTTVTNLFLPRLASLLSGRLQTWQGGPPRRVLTWAGAPGGGAGAAWPAGMISEKTAEATHKRVRQYRLRHNRKDSRGSTVPYRTSWATCCWRATRCSAAWVCSSADASTGADTDSCSRRSWGCWRSRARSRPWWQKTRMTAPTVATAVMTTTTTAAAASEARADTKAYWGSMGTVLCDRI